jgi:hypothetical protein
LITITRLHAHQLRAMFRRTFNNVKGIGPVLSFTAGPEGLRVRAKTFDAVVEHLTPGELPPDEIAVPFELLAACEGRGDQPVTIEALSTGQVETGWRDGNVPQMVRYDAVAAIAEFPGLPKQLIKNPPQLLRALHDAGEMADLSPIRFALGHIQLCGASGAITATDGKQLLVQCGFQFPWEEKLLIPRAKVFGSAELPQDQPVAIGKTDDWVAVRVGPWTFFFSVNKDGRYPDIDRQIPKADNAVARMQLDTADAEFLGKSLPKLPCDDEHNLPVTLDLNGSVAIRAKGEKQDRPTELVLSRATHSGVPIRINTNRKFLVRALKLGFRELFVFGDTLPVLCKDEQRQYVWALLDPSLAIASAKDAIRIESPKAEESKPTSPTTKPKIERNKQPVSEPIASQNGNGHAQANGQANGQTNGHANGPANGQTNGHASRINGQPRRIMPKAGQQDLVGLIQQTETLRTALRDTLVKTNELVKGLKWHRRQSRAVQNTIASLRQLKTLGV